MSIGIYKIENKQSHKCYIGQSTNIEKRWEEHKRAALSYNCNTYIHRAIRKYGIDNFNFEIIEYCKKSELNQKEIDWIKKLDTFNNGYNCTTGGYYCEIKNKGENHSNAKLTNQDVYNIREQRLQGKNRQDIYLQYSNKISIKGFQHIWEGDRFTNIHMDIYNKITTPKKPKLSTSQIKQLRQDALNGMTKKQLIDKYNISRRTVERVIQNKSRKRR